MVTRLGDTTGVRCFRKGFKSFLALFFMVNGLDYLDGVVADVKEGRPVIIVDSADREHEGDVFIAAEKITPDGLAFMRRYATGLICVPIYPGRLEELGLPLMVPDSYRDELRCRFTISVDWRHITDNGMSDYDRIETIRALIDPRSVPGDFYRPGHVFPLRAEERGLRERLGHTEASVALARAAGLYPAGVICEVISDDGEMARGTYLEKFAEKHNIRLCSVADLIEKGF